MDLLAKLQIKNPAAIDLIATPDDLKEALADAGLVADAKGGSTRGLLAFCRTKKELQQVASRYVAALPEEGLCWLAYLKKSGNLSTDITRDVGSQILEELGWLAVRQVSLNDNWSALRFRPQSQIKTLKRGTDYPGIDREKKIVTLPEDLKEALETLGFVGKFEELSFSQRRELVVGILDAKRAETRTKRIQKVVEQLQSSGS